MGLPASLGIHPYLLLGFGKPQGFAFPAQVPWEKHPLLCEAHRQDVVAPIPAAPEQRKIRNRLPKHPTTLPSPSTACRGYGDGAGPCGVPPEGTSPPKLPGERRAEAERHRAGRIHHPQQGEGTRTHSGTCSGAGTPPQAPLWQRGAAGSASHPARYAAAARRMETSGSGPQTSGAPS